MEMRDRLLHTLKVAASDQAEEDPLAKAVRLDLDLDRAAFKERSQSTLKFLLHSFGDLNIGTIDQFNLKIIRSFARDLRLPMNFEIEMQQEVLLERVISNMLSDLGNQDAIDQVLLDYSKWKITEGKSWKIEKDLFDTAKQLYDDHAEERLNQLKKLTPAEYLDLIKALREERKRLDQQITQEAEAVIALVETRIRFFRFQPREDRSIESLLQAKEWQARTAEPNYLKGSGRERLCFFLYQAKIAG